jgi:hypothetical protein
MQLANCFRRSFPQAPNRIEFSSSFRCVVGYLDTTGQVGSVQIARNSAGIAGIRLSGHRCLT